MQCPLLQSEFIERVAENGDYLNDSMYIMCILN